MTKSVIYLNVDFTDDQEQTIYSRQCADMCSAIIKCLYRDATLPIPKDAVVFCTTEHGTDDHKSRKVFRCSVLDDGRLMFSIDPPEKTEVLNITLDVALDAKYQQTSKPSIMVGPRCHWTSNFKLELERVNYETVTKYS